MAIQTRLVVAVQQSHMDHLNRFGLSEEYLARFVDDHWEIYFFTIQSYLHL